MAKKTSETQGTSLVIVESPAKARTIGKFLGPGYTIEASIGHIRDLPQGAKEVPAEYKDKDWAHLGVDVSQDFKPVYVIPSDKTQQVRKLKGLLKEADDLYLATDEDREGEAISWHLCEVLQPKVPVRRLVFHEITEEAIREALDHPRTIDSDLVRAQEARRIIDRLYGYEVSPLLWRKIRPRLSAGRVQSVAVRLIVQREKQRMAFVGATYWDLVAAFARASGEQFEAELVSVDGRPVPASRDFDPSTGHLRPGDYCLLDEPQARSLAQRVQGAACRVRSIDDKPYTTRPYPPFTTSTLQQEANRKYGFTARHTMQLAQSLYENGHITYMRTDSTNLASVAIDAARELVRVQYGEAYLPEKPRTYQTKVKNAQEAHEAIRPAGHPFALPESLRNELGPDAFRLYDLIWKRTIASQMNDARGHRMTITVEADGAVFNVSGKTIEFPGYLRAYVEGSDDPEAELADREVLLPQVAQGETLAAGRVEPKSHTTQPPNRYSEASLTRALEELGIGRPSTYAAIIDTILARDYVFKRANALVPTWVAFAVAQLLEEHFAKLVDYQFTAEMEDELDAISRGEMGHVDYLRGFYFGGDAVAEKTGLRGQLELKVSEIDPRAVSRILVGQPAGGEPVYVRIGKQNPFLEQGQRRANIPDRLPPDELTLQRALELLDKAEKGDEPLGADPASGKPVYMKIGRYGPYVQRGENDDPEKQNASLLPGMEPEEIDLELALRLLLLPREVGLHPETGQPVVAHNGRYGPYVKCGDETRSLPDDVSALDVTLERALELLAQPKSRRGAPARSKEPLKVFEESPVTGKPVQLLAGRYGPYVTDGTTNASIPKGVTLEEVTLPYALELLRARAEMGGSKRATRKTAKKAAKKVAKKAAKKAVKAAKKTAKAPKKAAKKTTKKKA